MTTATKEYKVVGTRPIRHDGADKVTGRAVYGADMNLPGMIYGKVLRSPHAHARILSIDTSKAEAHPDVRAVATNADFAPSNPVGPIAVLGQMPRDNILARDKVLYKGHAVAAVAAVSPHAAEEILSLIDIEYEVLPAYTNIEDSMAEDAVPLHDTWPNNPDLPGGVNVAALVQYRFGDPEAGFAEADQVFEREYRTKTVHQGYIEPQNATAWWAPDGRLTVWCSSQGHFGVRDNTARILGLPVSDVKVVPLEIGGGFGGKIPPYLEPVAAVMSKRAGAQSRWSWTAPKSSRPPDRHPAASSVSRSASPTKAESPPPTAGWPWRLERFRDPRSPAPRPPSSLPTSSKTSRSTATMSSPTSRAPRPTALLARQSSCTAQKR